MSAEQQTYLYYKAHGHMYQDPRARELYAEIGEVEEEHVSMYESLLDPTETLLERQVFHQLMEVYNYYHCYTHESDPRIRDIWDEFLHMELAHLQMWGEMLKKYQGVEPEILFGRNIQVDFKFQENKEYVRRVLDRQRQVRLQDHGWAVKGELPADWPSYRYQQMVNADGVPSEEIVDFKKEAAGSDGRPGDDLLSRARELALQFRQEGG
jgi:hypothetical protein